METLHFWRILQHYDRASDTWEEISIPQAEINGWNQLFKEFVADIQGVGKSNYPNFRDGWIANEVIDIVRHGQNWTALPTSPAID